MSAAQPIRVLVVDDSSTARLMISRALAADGRFLVVGTLGSAEEVLARVADIAPDVMTLDIELPGLNGIELLQQLRTLRPVPTVVVSAYSARGTKLSLDALEAGAVDVVEKPGNGVSPEAMFQELRAKVAIAATARVGVPMRSEAVPRSSATGSTASLVAIGASTGGPQAVTEIVRALPVSSPPVVIVIHMPGGFTRSYAQRLDDLAELEVTEASEGDELRPGHAYVAPGGRQFRVRRRGAALVAELGGPERVGGFVPAVDVMFDSIAQCCGGETVAALLTGMGEDGARGLLAIRQAGGRTLAQDDATSVVWGMPRAAWQLGAAESLAPLGQIAARLLSLKPFRQAR